MFALVYPLSPLSKESEMNLPSSSNILLVGFSNSVLSLDSDSWSHMIFSTVDFRSFSRSDSGFAFFAAGRLAMMNQNICIVNEFWPMESLLTGPGENPMVCLHISGGLRIPVKEVQR